MLALPCDKLRDDPLEFWRGGIFGKQISCSPKYMRKNSCKIKKKHTLNILFTTITPHARLFREVHSTHTNTTFCIYITQQTLTHMLVFTEGGKPEKKSYMWVKKILLQAIKKFREPLLSGKKHFCILCKSKKFLHQLNLPTPPSKF